MKFRINLERTIYGVVEVDAIDRDDVYDLFARKGDLLIDKAQWETEYEVEIGHLGVEEIGQSSLWQ